MLNRSVAPSYTNSFSISLPSHREILVDGNNRGFILPSKEGEVLRIDVIFPCGRIHESRRAQNRMCIKSVYSGSPNYSQEEFNELMDFHGAVSGAQPGMDSSSFSLSLLVNQAEKLVPIWLDMLASPSFPQEEIKKRAVLSAESLERELAKNSVIAYRELSAAIFGKDHPYGYNTMPEDYLKISSSDLSNFYMKCVDWSEAKLVISGNIPEKIETLLVSKLLASKSKQVLENLDIHKFEPQHSKIKGIQIKQSTIKIGKRLFNFDHEDGRNFHLLNLILGGYFGSRLIKNIREEKGFCYHIDSSIDSLKHDGYFSITANVTNENVDPTIKEIFKEIKTIQQDLIPESEFQTAKNYLRGQLLNFIDGPFATASIIKNYLKRGSNPLYFNTLVSDIEAASRENLRDLAQKYLKIDELFVFVVGQ